MLYCFLEFHFACIRLQVASSVGTFGRVLQCWDREMREFVAIKVVRSIRKYRDAAMIEIDVLNLLAKNDRGGSRYVIVGHKCESQFCSFGYTLTTLYFECCEFFFLPRWVAVCKSGTGLTTEITYAL